LLVGAVYVNQNVPAPGAQEQACAMPGLYVAEVTSALRVDALAGALQPFPVSAVALEEPGFSAELWLKADETDINAPDDATVIAELSGTARRSAAHWPFLAEVTIGANRRVPDPDRDRPGANPICSERIVSPISVEVRPREGARLVLRISAERWLRDVDFAAFEPSDRVGSDGPYRFRDAPSGAPSVALFNGIKAAGAYSVAIED
jgi:hypothetical protein